MTPKVEVVVYGQSITVAVDGIIKYQSDIGTKPPLIVPTPHPDPILEPTPTRTVPYHLYQGETREGLEYKFRNGYAKMPEGWSWEEFEASGFMEDVVTYGNKEPEFTGTVIKDKHHRYRVELHKGDEQTFTIPSFAGEEIEIILLEVQGTPDSLQTNSYITDERGRILAGPEYFIRHGRYTFKAQGSLCFLSITATDSGPIGIQRN